MNLFELRDVQEMADSFAGYMPGGKLFQSKWDSVRGIRMFLNGLAVEGVRANNLLKLYSEEIYPDTTVSFIPEWERVLAIPDDCLIVEGASIAERQRNIIIKLAGMNVQTSEDFELVALAFGVSATVVGGKHASVSPVITPDKTARNTIVVRFVPTTLFPYTFPITFGSSAISVLECLFLKMRPATSAVRFDAI